MRFVVLLLCIAAAPATAPSTAPSDLTNRAAAVKLLMQQKLAGLSAAQRNDPYVVLRTAITQRFLDRIAREKQNGSWSLLQLEECEQILKDNAQGGDFPDEPIFHVGYGHFDAAMRDIPQFPGLGASIVQDGRVGPKEMSANGTLSAKAMLVRDNLDLAAKNGMSVDFLLSPHYFPAWAVEQTPDVANQNPGFLHFNIDHPKARAVMTRWVEALAPLMQNQPALYSVCLSNEPMYSESGRDTFSRPAWTKFLRERHRGIDLLNRLYDTKYIRFEDVPPPPIGMPKEIAAQRAYFDWIQFNQLHFAQWHAFLHDLIKSKFPDTPTHAKIMVFFAFDRDKLQFGIDPELMCDATDLAGCDAYAFVEGNWAYNWMGHEFFYDLLHSFRKQPVFNSENHLIPDGSPPKHISSDASRAAIWQGGLHHQRATTIWVWEEPKEPALAGSIYLRPANIYGVGRAMLDLNRFSEEAEAIERAEPRIALLYSPTSIFWEETYRETITSLYTMLTFCGESITFVSEKQLADAKSRLPKWIIVPRATHVTDTTVRALQKHLVAGGRLILAGDGNLQFDGYHRERKIANDLATAHALKLQTDPIDTAKALRELLVASGMPNVGDVHWGTEYRILRQTSQTLVPIINLTKSPQVIKLDLQGRAIDLLTDEQINLGQIKLAPAVPRLLRIEGAK